MSHEYIATADEINEVKIWTVGSFHSIFAMKIPSEIDKNSCFEFAEGTDPHENFSGESNIIELKFLKERGNEHFLLALENRGCIHVLNAKEGKISQLHVVNIGQYACFDMVYEISGTMLFSFDIDLNIRIFSKSENIDLDEFKIQALTPLNLERKMTVLPKKVTFVRNDTLEPPILEFTISTSPENFNANRRATVSKNTLPANTRKRTKAIFNRDAANEEPTEEIGLVNKKPTVVIGWAFYLVKKLAYMKDTIPVSIKFNYITNLLCREELRLKTFKLCLLLRKKLL